jgi:hypothetical protein
MRQGVSKTSLATFAQTSGEGPSSPVRETQVTIDQGVGLRIEESRVARELRRLGMPECAVERAVANGLGLTPAELHQLTGGTFGVGERNDALAVVEAEVRSLTREQPDD